jgi:hypothetical protein
MCPSMRLAQLHVRVRTTRTHTPQTCPVLALAPDGPEGQAQGEDETSGA